MKNLAHRILLFVSFTTLAATQVLAVEEEISEEATEEVRVIAAKDKLISETDTVVVFAKGLCCPSCAIGVRKMVSRLDWVDRKRFNKGVELDTKTQLIMVAVAEEKSVDLDSLSEAIFDAGYDPVHSYSLKDGQLSTEPLTADS